MYLLWL